MIKPVDPALKSAYDQWAKKGWDNQQKNGAVNFITSPMFIQYIEALERKAREEGV